VDELSARIEARSGFVVMRHQLELYGKCADCSREP
jgi:Fe2+ or Zn2+ uptake regulation protein